MRDTAQAPPSAFDWRALNGVTAVRDQGMGCDSSWAFATVAVMESVLKIWAGSEVDLSEQYLIAHNEDGWGCHGGGTAHDYHVWRVPWGQREPGAVLESECPYTASDAPCPGPHPLRHPYVADGWAYVENDVVAIKDALYRYGPVKVSLCAGPAFIAYQPSSGVFETAETAHCEGGTNHDVVLVGWDDAAGTAGAWIARNSWGEDWGDGGYITIGYGVSNIGSTASYLVYDGLPLEPWDQVGGNTTVLDLAYPNIYAGVGPRLVILDVSNPAAPVAVGESEAVFDALTGIAVAGPYAYVTDAVLGLTVVDISNPAAMAMVGRYSDCHGAQDVVVSGTLAYLVDDASLYILDVSDPAAPFLSGGVRTAGHPRNVALAGAGGTRYAYVADGSAGLTVVDVTDTAQPTTTGTLALGDIAYDVAVQAGFAYVTYGDGIGIVDVADPAAPSMRGALDTPDTAYGVVVSGTLAYVTVGPGGLRVMDVTDPDMPSEVGYLALGGTGTDVELHGAEAFVASGETGLRVIDVSSTAAPQEMGAYQPAGDVVDIAFLDDFAFLAGGELGVWAVDTATTPLSVMNVDYTNPDYAAGLDLVSATLYIADTTSLRMLDVTTPSAPVEVGSAAVMLALDVAIEQDYAYLAGGCSGDLNFGLLVYDVYDAGAPYQIAYAPVSGCAFHVDVAGSYLYVLTGPLDAGFNHELGGLSIFDITTPSAPSAVAYVPMDPPPIGLTVGPGYAYVAVEGGVQVLDLSNPASPALVTTLLESAEAVALMDDLLYGAGNSGIWVYDVQTPTAVTLAGRLGPGFAAHALRVVDGYAWVGPQNRGGLERLRLLRDRVTGYVQPNGGTVSSKGSVATLVFPGGVFAAETAVPLRHLMSDPAVPGHATAARTFVLDAVDHAASTPISANLAYTAVVTYALDAGPDKAWGLYLWDGAAWSPAASQDDRANRRVSGVLNAITPFALLSVQPPLGLALEAPEAAMLGTPVIITATVIPSTATQPLALTWRATDQTMMVTTPADTVNGMTYTWSTPGPRAITVTVENAGGMVTATHLLTITDVPIVDLTLYQDGPTVLGWPTALTATVAEGTNVIYAWTLGDGAVANGNVISYTYGHGGDFNVGVLATNSAGTVSATDVVSVLTPTVAFARDAITVDENAGDAVLPVILDMAAGVTVTVGTTTGGGTASPGGDYTATVGTLTFRPGTTALTSTIYILNDELDEEDETLSARLFDPFNVALGVDESVVYILDDDLPPVVSIPDASRFEGDGGASDIAFDVALSGASGKSITITYATEEDSALPNVDYTPVAGTLTFTPGLSTRTLVVPVLGDTLHEPDETFSVSLSNSVHATLYDAIGVGTILNDDAPPQIGISDTQVQEGDGGMAYATFTVTLSGSTAQTVTVTYATGEDTASEGTDYASTHGVVTWSPGESLQTVAVPVYGDLIDETDESFSLNLTDPVNAILDDGQGVATILDDDTAVLYTGDVFVTEGDAGTTPALVPVTLTVASSRPITVSYTTYDIDALSGFDYQGDAGTLTFATGETSATLVVPVLGDLLDEDDEVFGVQLSDPHNVILGASVSAVHILDDDALPTVSVADASLTEGDAGTTDMTFDVALSAPSGRLVTVTYATQPGTAQLGSDYTPVSGTLTFDPGAMAQRVAVPVLGDLLHEPDETLSVTLSQPVNASIADGTGAGTIYNDDALPRLWISDAQVVEGTGGEIVTTLMVTLTGESGQIVSVDYATGAGTASPGLDYTAVSGTLVWYPGDDVHTLDIVVLGDDLDEIDEAFHLTLSNPTHAGLGDAQGVVTIVDDDTSVLHASSILVSEGDAGTTPASLVVTLTVPSSRPITVSYATYDAGALAGTDYHAVQGALTFPPGETSAALVVPVVGDGMDEDDEGFELRFTDPVNVLLGVVGAYVTILDDDLPPALSIRDASVMEGDTGTTAMTFDVTLSGASGKPVTVTYATLPGSAVAGSDYTPVTGSLCFMPGVTARSVTVPVLGDALHEPNETFSLTLSNSVNATLHDETAVGTILNDDGPPQLWIDDAYVLEGDDGVVFAVFTVTLAGTTTQTVTVDYATMDNTASGGEDYLTATGSLAWSPGERRHTVDVAVYGDHLDETDETFALTLVNAAHASLERSQAMGTIVDDDPLPSISLSDAAMTEGDAGTSDLIFPLVLSAPSGRPITITYETRDGTAQAGEDYTASHGLLLLAPGMISTTLAVPVMGDRWMEPNETFTVALTSGVNGAFARALGYGTILDDDGASEVLFLPLILRSD